MGQVGAGIMKQGQELKAGPGGWSVCGTVGQACLAHTKSWIPSPDLNNGNKRMLGVEMWSLEDPNSRRPRINEPRDEAELLLRRREERPAKRCEDQSPHIWMLESQGKTGKSSEKQHLNTS